MADYSLSDTEYAYQNDKIARMFFPPDSSYTKCYRIFWSIDAYPISFNGFRRTTSSLQTRSSKS